MSLRYLLVFLLLILLGGCSEREKKPKDLIAEDKYITLLVELQLIQSYGINAKADSVTLDSLTSKVFKKHDVTGEQFHTSHRYYQQFPKEQERRVDQAIELLKMDQVANSKESSDTTTATQ